MDSPNKYDQIDQQYHDDHSKYSNALSQNTKSNFVNALGNQSQNQFNNQQPNYQQPNYPAIANYPTMNNAFNNQNTNNQMWNQQQMNQKKMNRLPIDDKDLLELRRCSNYGFWFITVPAVFGTFTYQHYRAIKLLKPVGLGSVILNTTLAYIGSKVIMAPICLSRVNTDNLYKKIDEMKKNRELGFNEMQSNTGPPLANNQFPPYQQPRNSPYLQPRFRQEQQFQRPPPVANKSEFDDNDESNERFDKEDERNMLNKNF